MHFLHTELSQQAAILQMLTACITFDHPSWLKAIDVIHSHQLNIVCRLGPFHIMISFLLGCIITVVAGWSHRTPGVLL